MARSQIFPDDTLTRSQIFFSSERQRDPLAIDLGAASRPHKIMYTVDYVWEQDTSSPSFQSFPPEVMEILTASSPFFCDKIGLLPVQSAWSDLPTCGAASGISESSSVYACIQHWLAKLATLVCISCQLIFASRGVLPMSRKVVFSPSKFVKATNTTNPIVYSDMSHGQLVLFVHTLSSTEESRAGHRVGFFLSETRLAAYDFTEGKTTSYVMLTPA